MKRACSYCGRIHDKGVRCPLRPALTVRQRKKDTQASQYRSTAAWTRLSLRIRQRDKYICQACLYGLGSKKRLKIGEPVEVHHIDALEDHFEERDDEENLITLCRLHHDEAEAGEIDAEKMRQIAKANAKKD